MTAQLTWIFLAVCAAAMVGAPLLRDRVPVGTSIAVGAVLRIAFAALTSRMLTPRDVTIYFHTTGQLILQGKDPVHNMPGRQWNFLELMPFIHALEIRSGLPWVYAVKIAPILADLVLIWLVARFAGNNSRNRALQYALNPLSLLVVSLHGQVEPVALALALTGILLIRKGRPVFGGLLLGAAVAAKTWPVVILLAVLPLRNLPRAVRIVAGSAIVPLGCLLLGVIFLDTAPLKDLAHMASYTSFVRLWTWSGTVVDLLGTLGYAGYNSRLAGLGSLFILVGVIVTLILLRRRPPEVRALGVLSAVLLCTAGFGTQYLMWVLPLMFSLSAGIRSGYTVAATGYCAVFYLLPKLSLSPFIVGLSWLPAALLLIAWIELIRSRPVVEPSAVRLSGADPTTDRLSLPDGASSTTGPAFNVSNGAAADHPMTPEDTARSARRPAGGSRTQNLRAFVAASPETADIPSAS